MKTGISDPFTRFTNEQTTTPWAGVAALADKGQTEDARELDRVGCPTDDINLRSTIVLGSAIMALTSCSRALSVPDCCHELEARWTYSGGMGLSCDDRVVIEGVQLPPEALLAEVHWIERNHPDVKMYDWESKSCGAYVVDTITIKPKGGPKTVLHFDNGDVVGRFVAGLPQR